MHLLVVDWDYFFPTPTAGAPLGPNPELYAWPVAEDPMHVEAIWLRRLRAFQTAGVPLPYCRGFFRFWDRFGISPEAALFYADSNAWAGQIFPSDLGGAGPWESVHLYDAHHDCGYKQNHRSFADWRARGPISAENWLLAHYWAGSRLHVHFPPWRESMRRPTEEPLIPVSMTIDNGQAPNVVFDAVFVCRSGAWVPSWCDEQFGVFLEACPVSRRAEIPRNIWNQPRPDVLRMAELERAVTDSLPE